MHIPDGYLSPTTCAVLTGLMAPVWYRATRYLKDNLDLTRVPFMAMGAVFVFLVMMFNIPVPGGTTAHAIGAALIAIVLGPWAAVITVSIALFVQALLFGDGGILAFGANCFNMAFIMPFVGYNCYKLLGHNAAAGSWRQLAAAAFAGYAAINVAALAAGIELGLQPMLFQAADGTPLYCPYGLTASITAMALAHLTVGGLAEGVVTAVALKYVAVQSPALATDRLSGCKAAGE
jgi:cobalt/nickel transport system permease protein